MEISTSYLIAAVSYLLYAWPSALWEKSATLQHTMQSSIKKLQGVVCKVLLSHEHSFCKANVESISGYSHRYKIIFIKLFCDWGSVLLNNVILYRQKLPLGSSYPMG